MENKFLTNYSEITFLDKLKESFEKCKSFSLSVSFIKKAGLILFEKIIEEALARGVKGRIITSTYQNFTDIASLKTFKNWMDIYPNFECHLDYQCFGENGFHSKGYIFEYDDSTEFLVGSTNITRFALLKNVEWNVSISSTTKNGAINEAIIEYDDLWNKTLPLTNELIKKYQTLLDYAIEKWDMDYVDPISDVIRPNTMQRNALKELRRYRDMGVNKALVVSATGSGKTYLAAFDAKNYDAKRVLFVVHRDKILVDAKETFMKIFGSERTYGLYVGKNKDLDCDFIFASNIMLSQHLNDFDPNEFDYIIMDECHHAAASSYRAIMNYFKPGFLLGITATPERMDNQDVFEMFDRNVPYELRLKDAIINDLVVPFHYYGIRDKLADYSFKDNSKIAKEIAKVENIDFISKEIQKHYPAGKLKALAFCTNIAHCQLMADEFNDAGFNAVALTGKNDLGQRIKAFNDLQDDNNSLEIICAIDVLNEGVDIPQVNMVLFLRPTESSTIFLQQLGRGLRKYEGKQYVTVLDFIGNNYDRSIQIAMALGSLGDSTIIEKPYLKALVRNDFKALNIPGVVIKIDELSKEEIIFNLNTKNFNEKSRLQKDYENFKNYLKIEKFPSHMDYLNNDCAPDLMRFMKAKLPGKNRSYYTFLKKIGEETLPIFTDKQIEVIDKLSDLLPLVRADEYLIVNQILNEKINLNKLVGYNSHVNVDTLKHALKHLNVMKLLNTNYELNVPLNEIFKTFLSDLLLYGLERYDIEYGDYSGDFKLYGNYYSDQIQTVKLQSFSPFMKGTEFDVTNKKTYCYVTLHKDANKDERLQYKDKFLSASLFQWESVKDTTKDKGDGPKLLNTKEVYLFVRKIKEEDGVVLPFTYFGTGKFVNLRTSSTSQYDDEKGQNREYPTLMFDILLDNPVSEDYWFDFEIPDEKKVN